MNSELSKLIGNKVKELKSKSGTHSPSIATVLREIPELKIQIDACFLSNPYATDLFFRYFDNDLIKTGSLIRHLEFYPPQNYDVAKVLSKVLNIDPEMIFVGNGAIEIIQMIIHRFVENRMVVILPTFSSYYEFKRPDTEVFYYSLEKNNDYALDVDDYISYVKKVQPDTIVIINPNNPNGGYLSQSQIKKILSELSFVKNIVLDESFIHFAFENESLDLVESTNLIKDFPNLIIVKSMSKDFGIAGIRAGYGIMSRDKVKAILSNGYLWNISGLAYYFFETYSRVDFIEQYELLRKKYIKETFDFIENLSKINGIKVYPSKANFALIEITNGISSFDFSMNLLANHGVYARDCSDKIGLDGQFVRMASRSLDENKKIVTAISNTING